jgi:hypothetical protein
MDTRYMEHVEEKAEKSREEAARKSNQKDVTPKPPPKPR